MIKTVDAFVGYNKIPRLFRDIIISEKIDGTNAQIFIPETGEFKTGKRTQYMTSQNDNYGFAKWAEEHKEELLKLGSGRHFGEWWGQGIQRNYGLKEKRFSLFHPKWNDETLRPSCCYAIPILYTGSFSLVAIQEMLNHLRKDGSYAVPGFMKPEGIVIYHTAAKQSFKVTIDNDEQPKSAVSKGE